MCVQLTHSLVGHGWQVWGLMKLAFDGDLALQTLALNRNL